MKTLRSILFVLILAAMLIGTTAKTVLRLPERAASYGGGRRGAVLGAWESLQEGTLSETAFGHDVWIDAYGLVLKTAGVDVIPDGERTVYRLQDGAVSFLLGSAAQFSPQDLAGIRQLREAADRVGAQSLMISFPRKLCAQTYPFACRGLTDPRAAAEPVFKAAFLDSGWQVTDLHQRMHEAQIDHALAYYRTDHHWKTTTALWAAKEIAGAIGLDASALDAARFEKQTHAQMFLGAEGKHCGRLYSGMDDVDVYLPREETSFVVTPLGEGEVKTGDFSQTLLAWRALDPDRSPYEVNPYAVFLGGDGSRRIENKLCPDGPHILLIKDSFGNSVAPYLALLCRQVDVIDPRNYTGSLSAYTEENRPDVVCVMLSICMGSDYFDETKKD